jgi:lipopolysaccharide transport system ATP-binding protein
MSTVITVPNLGKKYRLNHQGRQESYLALRDVLADGVRTIGRKLAARGNRGGARPSSEDFWALREVGFEVKQGDRIGIIGRNGAGKSTLLKILSRITEPTTGSVRIRGRVASLLEVGTGFHPELTGRENIYLNGAILGMHRAEIRRKFDEIVDFAEIERFLDTPVKRYSSGMYVRLAFAVAAHLEPEILIVDEVLAVGDAQFQKKCLGKMEDVSSKDGRTVLFVSHNMAAIKALCRSAMVLSKGRLVFQGEAAEACNQYQAHDVLNQNHVFWKDIVDAPGNENIRLKAVTIRPLHGPVIDIDSGIEMSTVFHNSCKGKNVDFLVRVYSLEGICIFESGIIMFQCNDSRAGYYSTKCIVPPQLLNSGSYKLNFVFGESQRYLLCEMEDVVSFDVENTLTGRGSNMARSQGIIRPSLDWSFSYTEEFLHEPG